MFLALSDCHSRLANTGRLPSSVPVHSSVGKTVVMRSANDIPAGMNDECTSTLVKQGTPLDRTVALRRRGMCVLGLDSYLTPYAGTSWPGQVRAKEGCG